MSDAPNSGPDRPSDSGIADTGSVTLAPHHRRLLLIVFVACLGFEVLFFVLDLVVNHQRGAESRAIRRIFNTAREGSLPSWFGVTQTFVIGSIALLNFALLRRLGAATWRRTGWIVLAVLFVYLSMDDGAKIHERLGTASKSFELTSGAVKAYPSYAWQVIVGPVFLALGLFMLCFLWKELKRPFDRFAVVLALGCLTLAVAMDYVEGLEDGYALLLDNFDWSKGAVEHFAKSAEETLEMFGMTIFLVVFLGHAMRLSPVTVVRVQGLPPE